LSLSSTSSFSPSLSLSLFLSLPPYFSFLTPLSLHLQPSSRLKQLPPTEQIYDQLSPLTPSPSPNATDIESAVEFSSNARAPRPDPSTISPSHTHTQQHPSTTGTAPATGGMLSAQLEVFHHSFANMQLKKHGYLQRKRLFDAQGKRGKGGWQKVYTSLDNFQLKFFTDHKIAMDPATKPLGTFHLLQANVCTYTKEKKVKHSFMVSSPFGEQFLLQAETATLMNDWYSTIQTCVHKANEDYKLHPDKYADLRLDDGEISPKVLVGKGRRKGSKDIQPLSVAIDEDEELDNMELSDKSDRIRNRLRRLMARRPQMETLQKKGIIEDPVFGADLAKYCECKKVLVPQFLVQFMEHIEANGLDTVGLYRLSGNAASVQKLRCLVEQDSPFNLDDAEWADINIVTGCLKLYFRELPDPLIPASQFQKFIDAAKLAPTPAQRISGLADQVKELPKINYCTLVALMKHLRKVMDNGAVNMMRSQNVSIVFGPTLLRAEGDPFEMAKLTPFQNGIVELMLTEFEKIFTRK
ncbi:Rho GTPase-activating protein 15, partial [Geodia barretti]